MDTLVSHLLSWSFGMLGRGVRFFAIAYCVTAAIFVIVDPLSPGTWIIVGVAGLMGFVFWSQTRRWQREWTTAMERGDKTGPAVKGRSDA